MAAIVDDRGPHAAPPAPALPPLSLRERLLVFAALQLGGLALLAGAGLLASAVAPLFGGGAARFASRWAFALVVVPVTFVPALVVWHRWAVRRFGKRGAYFRLVAEVAFAVEVIGCVLFQNIA